LKFGAGGEIQADTLDRQTDRGEGGGSVRDRRRTHQSTHLNADLSTGEKGGHQMSQLRGVPGQSLSSLRSLRLNFLEQCGQREQRGNSTRGVRLADRSDWMDQTSGHDSQELHEEEDDHERGEQREGGETRDPRTEKEVEQQ
jgi:hypothetical protein